jgi:hypothetical protein
MNDLDEYATSDNKRYAVRSLRSLTQILVTLGLRIPAKRYVKLIHHNQPFHREVFAGVSSSGDN